MWQLFRAFWLFFLAEKAVVVLLVLIPAFTTWLPRLVR